VESVVLLSQQKSTDRISVEVNLEDLDTTTAEAKATYAEIKQYVERSYGLNVSSLYISQVKRKMGLDVGDSYNKPKTEGAKVPVCPPEKEKAIIEALCFFKMI